MNSGYLSRFEPAISNLYDIPGYKGTFFKESTDVFVITSNRRTFFFPETENLNFGD